MMRNTGSPKCLVHGEMNTAICGWCSMPICDSCIDEAGGKKYCKKCYSEKISKTPLRAKIEKQGPVKNIDPAVDTEAVRAAVKKDKNFKLDTY